MHTIGEALWPTNQLRRIGAGNLVQLVNLDLTILLAIRAWKRNRLKGVKHILLTRRMKGWGTRYIYGIVFPIRVELLGFLEIATVLLVRRIFNRRSVIWKMWKLEWWTRIGRVVLSSWKRLALYWVMVIILTSIVYRCIICWEGWMLRVALRVKVTHGLVWWVHRSRWFIWRHCFRHRSLLNCWWPNWRRGQVTNFGRNIIGHDRCRTPSLCRHWWLGQRQG